MLRQIAIPCLLLAALSLAACSSTGDREPPPKINLLRPANPLTPESQPASGPTIQAMVRRVDLPLNGSLEKAWAAVTTAGLDEVTVALWKANGFRVGLLDMKRYPEFVAAIPDKISVEAQVIVSTGTPNPFAAGPLLTKPTRIKVTSVTREKMETLKRGTPQLVADFAIGEDNAPTLTLTPHHYYPKATIEIRSPLATQLDGRVFEELSLHTSLPSDRILVIALDWPPPPATQPEPTEEGEESSPMAEMATAVEQPAEPARPRDLLLADLLLSAERTRKAIQRVIMIGVPVEEAKKK